MSNIIKIHPVNPQEKHIETAVKVLRNGGIIILPTDGVYSYAADIKQPKGLEKLARIKGKKVEESHFSFLFDDLSQVSDYTMQFDKSTFKVLKRGLPGPYTFILNANKSIPKIFQSRKSTIGIRMPDNKIARMIVRELGNPIATTSVTDEDSVIEYTTDPELIQEKFGHTVDLVVDGGIGQNVASTVIDLTQGEIELLRQGQGEVEQLL
ncbi:MAG: threonylcarbamoyl-AMP synthase [Bacteroidota bacterium]|nr:threonylcarbamoyl-AMP synthase [Bacteroidota bacterium]MDX5404326.1 threonylcarbamoyl-AMP synthase [Bacteroidota bacterium]MDX5447520.1 threonylcarbamoyl-AMP synthase [Bacteroidota bacterium]